MNIIKTKIKPVGPNVIPGAQYHIYAPIVSPNQAGLAKFDKIHFTVDEDGVVRFNDSYIKQVTDAVHLNPEDASVTQTVNSPIEVKGLLTSSNVKVDTITPGGLYKDDEDDGTGIVKLLGNLNVTHALDAFNVNGYLFDAKTAMRTPRLWVGAIEKRSSEQKYITIKDAVNFEDEAIFDHSIVVEEDVTVEGDLIVKGTAYTVRQETIMVDDNLLVLNSSGDSFSNAGFVVKTSDTLSSSRDYEAYGVIYDPFDNTLKLGHGYLKGEPYTEGEKYELDLAGNFKPIATRLNFDIDYDRAIPEWSDSKKSFIPSSLTFNTLSDDYYDEELLFTNSTSKKIIGTDHLRAGASIQTGSGLDLGLIPKAYGLRDGSSILGSRTKYVGTEGTAKNGLRCHTRGWDLQVLGADTIADGKFNYVAASLAYMYGLGYSDTKRYNSFALDFFGNMLVGNKIYVHERVRANVTSDQNTAGANNTGTKYQVLSKSPTDVAYIKSLSTGSLAWHTTKPSTNNWVLNRIKLVLNFDFTSDGVPNNYYSNTLAIVVAPYNSNVSSFFSIEQFFEKYIDIDNTNLYIYTIKITAAYSYSANGLIKINLYGIHEAGCVDLSYLSNGVRVTSIEYLY